MTHLTALLTGAFPLDDQAECEHIRKRVSLHLIERAVELHEEGDHETAVRFERAALRINPLIAN